MFKKISLKIKLLSGFGVLALISAVLGFVGYLSVVQQTNVVKNIGKTNFPIMAGLSGINKAQPVIDGAEKALHTQNLKGNGGNSVYEIFDEALKFFPENRKRYEETKPTTDENAKYKTLISAFDNWMKDHNDFVTLVKAYDASPSR